MPCNNEMGRNFKKKYNIRKDGLVFRGSTNENFFCFYSVLKVTCCYIWSFNKYKTLFNLYFED